MNQINVWLVAAFAFLAIAAVGIAALFYGNLSTAHSKVTEQVRELKGLREDLDVSRQDRVNQTAALARERDAAVAAERATSETLQAILRDVGTTRDAPTAPVLRRFEK